MNTDIDLNNKENINSQKDNFDGLGKRGGTLGYSGNARSDSNPTKHRVIFLYVNFFRIIDTVISKMT